MQSSVLNQPNASLSGSRSETDVLLTTSLNTLQQLYDGLTQLTPMQYTQSPEADASAIGRHVRHILEFYQALFVYMRNTSADSLCYDKRQRNLQLETSADAALQEIDQVRSQLGTAYVGDCDINLASIIVPGAPMVGIKTTLYRELFYLLDHTIHHMALIKMLAQKLGVNLDRSFGLAQSTKAHEISES